MTVFYRYKCDACGSEAENTSERRLPTGWYKITGDKKKIGVIRTKLDVIHCCPACVGKAREYNRRFGTQPSKRDVVTREFSGSLEIHAQQHGLDKTTVFDKNHIMAWRGVPDRVRKPLCEISPFSAGEFISLSQSEILRIPGLGRSSLKNMVMMKAAMADAIDRVRSDRGDA